MSYPKTIHAVQQELGNTWYEMLYDPTAHRVGRAISQIAEKNERCDLPAVARHLAIHNENIDVEYLRKFAEHPEGIVQRCREIRGDATGRRLKQVAHTISESRKDPEELLQEVKREISILDGRALVSRKAKDSSEEFMADYERRREDRGKLLGIPTGFPTLDKRLSGLQAGKMYLVGARPAHGKTALADNIALAAAKEGYPVLILAHEMTVADHIRRMHAIHAGLHYESIERGLLDETDERELRESNGIIKDLPLWICARSGVDPQQYAAQAYSMRYEQGPGLVIIDYLQLERIPGNRTPRVDELARISGRWLSVAKETGHAILALSQLSRDGAGENPRLSHLRESGALEQDADVVMLLWRPGCDNDKHDERHAQLCVAKNRTGPRSNIDLYYDGPRMTFSESNNEEGSG